MFPAHRLAPCVVLLLAASAPVAQAAGEHTGPYAAAIEQAAAPSPLSAHVTVASQYVSRGIRQTWGRPALQAGADYGRAEGWRAGAWASTVDKRFIDKGSVEMDVYAGYSRPELPLQGRKELLESVLLWHGEAGFAPGFTQAQTFIDHARVPAALVAEVLRALRFVEARNPNMRPALTALLASTLDDGSKQACIRILMQVEDALRPQVLPMVLAKRAPGNVRAEDPESAMHSGRIRASDLVVAQVVDRVPRTSNWRSTLSQVAAYISAAKIDPQTDPLLLSSSRTGVSELDNALYTLQGPTQEGDANDALVHNPVYALTVQKRVVGLGHLAASLWQLLRDSPADAPSLQQQRQERQHARVNFILALARSVEISGRRVCGWGLSEQLTEVCAGYIKGIEQAPMIYPPQLLSQLAQNFAKSDVADDRMEQERFFHNAIAQAEHILFSPEAAEDFAAQLLEHMRQDYGWPKA